MTRGILGTDNFVATITNAPLSHAAIYDAKRDEVIEATKEGVYTSGLDVFLGKSRRALVIRPVWWTPGNANQAVESACGWIGKDYNYTGLIGLNTPERYYCTQLAIRAYESFIKKGRTTPSLRLSNRDRCISGGVFFMTPVHETNNPDMTGQ